MNLSISLRPRKFSDVYGQSSVVKELTQRSKDSNWPVAMLLKGVSGTGKSTCGQIIAMTINCSNPSKDNEPCGACPSCLSIMEERFDRDTVVLDGSTIGKKDDVTEFANLANLAPMYDKKKVLIIEEADQLSDGAKNALHKILEKPRTNVHFILLSMVATGVPPSIQSRCQTFNFKPFMTRDIAIALKTIMENKGYWKDDSIPDSFKLEGLFTIAQASLGSLREAIQIFEKCLVGKYFAKEEIRDNLGIIDNASLQELIKNFLDVNPIFFKQFIDYNHQEFFRLVYKNLVDASIYKISKFIDPQNEYFQESIKALSAHSRLNSAIKLFESIQEGMSSYLTKSYLLGRLLSFYQNSEMYSVKAFTPQTNANNTMEPNSTMSVQTRLDAEAQARAVSSTNENSRYQNNIPNARKPTVTRL